MLDLHSPKWSTLSHAFGDASDVPGLIERLRSASRVEWSVINEELMSAILHQGDVYTATYAAMPHLLELATELGPSRQSDDLLYSLSCAAQGRPGPDCPEFLKESWLDAQDKARDLMLERLTCGEASPDYAGLLIAGILYLAGEWPWGRLVNDWLFGSTLMTKCPQCAHVQGVFWHEGGPKQLDAENNIDDIDVAPSRQRATSSGETIGFDGGVSSQQLLRLAASCGHSLVERQIRCLFGTLTCQSCGADVQLTSARE